MSKKPVNPKNLDCVVIAAKTLVVMKNVTREITNSLSDLDRDYFLEDILIGARRKIALKIDVIAEAKCRSELRKKFGDRVLLCGEEYYKRKNLDLSKENKLVALVDMVDGTDLLKRGMFNWGSAMILFYPEKKEIVAAFVSIPFDGVYYAVNGDKRVYKCSFGKKDNVKILRRYSRVRDLCKASICFYGQKIENFISVAKKKSFIKGIYSINQKAKDKAGTRLYNLAGNPMMIKLIQGNIDVIFELKGQPAHDVSPGAYIAMKAGAVFKDLNGKPIDIIKSLNRPADPKNYFRYILAANNKLFNQTKKLFS